MNLNDFWYIACPVDELSKSKPKSIKLMDEKIVLFIGDSGNVVAMRDRCLHRAAPLSKGKIKNGCLTCPYHGWVYDEQGKVVTVPSEGPEGSKISRKNVTFAVKVQQGYVYLCLAEKPSDQIPFKIPHFQEKGWHSIRLQNLFKNSVTNCAENFVDIPHTVFVHPGIFRTPRGQRIKANVTRDNGHVRAEYIDETDNLGWLSRFLNRSGSEIIHVDNFYMPNVTCVEYKMSEKRHLFITSQSIPVTDNETLVFTDLTYNYGLWSLPAKPVLRWYAQTIINQDKDILGDQMESIEKYGEQFQNSPSDVIHIYIESVRKSLVEGKDPRQLPLKNSQIEFWA